MVDLNNPRLEFIIEENIEAKDFKAHGVLNIIRLAAPIGMCELWLDRQQALDDGRLNVFHYLIRIMTLLLNVLQCVR